MKTIKRPVVGEWVDTPHGSGIVKAILDWKDIMYGINGRKLKKIKEEVNGLLGNAEKFYFEFVVENRGGELKMCDWSEYKDNFH